MVRHQRNQSPPKHPGIHLRERPCYGRIPKIRQRIRSESRTLPGPRENTDPNILRHHPYTWRRLESEWKGVLSIKEDRNSTRTDPVDEVKREGTESPRDCERTT